MDDDDDHDHHAPSRTRRTPPRISPPPLKRRRLNSSWIVSGLTEKRKEHRDHDTSARDHDSAPSTSLTTPLSSRLNRASHDHPVSTSSDLPRPNFSTGSASTSRTCRTCKKCSTKNYDPLVRCSSCKRPYHDGCRKPALADGDDPDAWKCFHCIRNARNKHSPVAPPAASAPGTPGSRPSPRTETRLTLSKTVADGEGSSKATKGSGQSNVEQPATAKLCAAVPSDRTMERSRAVGVGVEALEEASNSPPCTMHSGKEAFTSCENVRRSGGSSTRPQGSTKASSEATALVSLQDDELDKLAVVSPMPKPSPTNAEQLSGLNGRTNRTEIPNTPTERSSQLPPESTNPSPPHLHPDGALHQLDHNDSTLMADQLEPETSVPFTTLCAACRKQRVLVKNGGEKARCRGCRNRGASLGNDEYMGSIPETPESVSTHHNDAQDDPFVLDLKSMVSKPDQVEKPASTVVGSIAKKIVTKKIPHNDIPISVRQSDEGPPTSKSIESEAEPQTSIDGLCNKPEASVASDRTRPSGKNTAESETAETTAGNTELVPICDGSITAGEVARKVTTEPNKDKMACSHLKHGQYSFREVIAMALVAANGSPRTSAQIQDWMADAFPEKYRKGRGTWENNVSAILSANEDFQGERQAGERSNSWSFASVRKRREYENRFPEYCVEACSSYPRIEFRTSKTNTVPQRDDGSQRSTPTPRKVQQRSRLSAVETASAEDEQHDLGDTGSVTTLKEATKALQALIPLVGSEGGNASKGDVSKQLSELSSVLSAEAGRLQPTPETMLGIDLDDTDAIFMPFEPRPLPKLDLDSGVRLEKDFYKAFPQYAWPSVETMTQREIDAKIAEIKMRPSRKATWGERLAFARTQRRDVHDELAGSRKTNCSTMSGEACPARLGGKGGNSEVQDKEQEVNTFRHIFDLPNNPIPMLHEGQLAFREGTLVNGRLPRPRVIYKVGKKFGGALRN